MPFVSPLLFGSSVAAFPAKITFEPDAGSGTAGTVLYNSNITVVQDQDNYFGEIDGDVNYDYIEFSTFGDYKFTVLENTLSGNSAIGAIDLIELAAEGPVGNFVEQTIFGVYTLADGALFPETTKTVSDTSSFVDGLATRLTTGSGTRSLEGSVTVGIKKL